MKAFATLKFVGFLTLGMLLGAANSARAVVTQPNGQVVPLTTRLQDFLNGSPNNNNINEGIDGVADAQVQPEQFSPLCDFSGHYVAKGGGANFAIGWYNVDDNRPSNMPPLYVPVNTGAGLNTPAANSDIFILFPFSNALPASNMLDLTAASIRTDSHYAGGLIGFALIPNPNGTMATPATQYHYTEKRFNVFCSLCSSPGFWISTLIYRSKQLADTFYLGFEDLDFTDAAGSAGTNGNDLDYEDFLFRFTGIACVGAGQPCTNPGAQGACQIGVTDCDAQGNIVCKSLIQPGQNSEVCDGLDNDCDGAVDDNAPCPAGQICDRGACSAPCTAEFPCPGLLTCDGGHCVNQACVGVTCNATETCRNGTCVDPCSGIACPSPFLCSGGLCIDPCTDPTTGMPVVCRDTSGNPDPKRVCVNGACVTSCNCLACGTGKTCDATSGKCVDPGCAGLACAAGEQCKNGACVPACQGAICPAGQICTAGKCIAPCGGLCGADQMCVGDKCALLCDSSMCESGQLCLDGACHVICNDVACEVGQECNATGTCVAGGAVQSGCSCRLAEKGTDSSAWAMTAALVLLGWAFSRSPRSRRSRQLPQS